MAEKAEKPVKAEKVDITKEATEKAKEVTEKA